MLINTSKKGYQLTSYSKSNLSHVYVNPILILCQSNLVTFDFKLI